MNLPFEHTSYQRYKNTFLNTVMLILSFPEVNSDDQDFYDRFKEYVKSIFDVNAPEDGFQNGLAINKGDGSVSINITKRQVIIILRGQKYESFTQSMLPHIFSLRNYFKKVAGIKKIDSLIIRKINVWNFKNEKNVDITSSGARNAIFSKELLGRLSSDNLTEAETALGDIQKCEWHEGCETLAIRSLFKKTNNKDGFTQLILDTEYMNSDANGFDVETLANTLLDYNNVLYQAYHWSVNDRVKDLMNN